MIRLRSLSARAFGQLVLLLFVFTLASSRALSLQVDTSVSVQPAQTGLAPAPGVDPALDEKVRRVSSHLRCPVCQGESIQDSPAELAGQMKTLVREQLAAGKSEAEVTDYFVQKYGQWILLAPRAEGFNLLVYWLPIVFILLGGVGIWFAVKRWTLPRPPAAE